MAPHRDLATETPHLRPTSREPEPGPSLQPETPASRARPSGCTAPLTLGAGLPFRPAPHCQTGSPFAPTWVQKVEVSFLGAQFTVSLTGGPGFLACLPGVDGGQLCARHAPPPNVPLPTLTSKMGFTGSVSETPGGEKAGVGRNTQMLRLGGQRGSEETEKIGPNRPLQSWSG